MNMSMDELWSVLLEQASMSTASVQCKLQCCSRALGKMKCTAGVKLHTKTPSARTARQLQRWLGNHRHKLSKLHVLEPDDNELVSAAFVCLA